jgi:alkane 1-monooxygenase
MTPHAPFDSPRHIRGFAVASLTPVALLLLGVAFGAFWFAAALFYLAILHAVIDRLAPVAADLSEGAEFPAGDRLLVTLGIAHLGLLPVAVWQIGGASGLSGAERAIAFAAFGLHFGQISNPAAHELIHRGSRALYQLGVAVYVTMLFGHHASAHRLVHHRHVATHHDPNTARRGESFYRFAPRAWIGSFRTGFAAENTRTGRLNPYVLYLAGAVLCLSMAWLIAGPRGLIVYIALALYATAQLLLSDYVQHYGLVRARLPDGRWEPVDERHSWNAAQPLSGLMTLNAPRHSDHHAHPARPFPGLRLPEGAPTLPRSLPVMGAVALVPPLWRRMMHPRLDRLARRSRESDRAGGGTAPADLAV